MSTFLENVVGKLPVSVQPYAKAFVPLVLGVALVVQDLAISVEEVEEVKVLVAAAVVSVITLIVPNLGYRAASKQY